MSVIRPPEGFQFTVDDMIEADGGRTAAWEQRARAGLVDVNEFVAILHRDIDDAIEHLQSIASSFVSASEDDVTRNLVTYLAGRRYDVSSEPFERGHVDILVRSRHLRLKWLAEAKIHSSDYDVAIEGMKQLLTRYASGAHDHGGFLYYVFLRNAKLIQRRLRAKIASESDAKTSCGTTSTADDPIKLRFRSSHRLAAGTDYSVRHHVVNLHFAPKDKSGVNSATKHIDEDEQGCDDLDALADKLLPPST